MATTRTTDGTPADGYVPSATRRAVVARDPDSCVYCGSRKRLGLDHVVPSCKGGLSVPANLVVACSACNSMKAGWPVDMFAMLLEREGRGTIGAILGRVYARVSTPCPELPPMAHVLKTGVAVDPASRGLDPKKYALTLSVHRLDEKPLTERELATIEAALAGDEMPEAGPAPKASSNPTPRTKRAAPAAKGKVAKTASGPRKAAKPLREGEAGASAPRGGKVARRGGLQARRAAVARRAFGSVVQYGWNKRPTIHRAISVVLLMHDG